MSDVSKLLNCVSSIYSASGNQAGWQHALQEIVTLTGATTGVYFAVNSEDLATDVSTDIGYKPEDVILYQSDYGAQNDIRFQYMHNLIPGQVFREYEFVTDQQAYSDSKWIQYQQEHYGLYWCMCAQISPHSLWQDIIAVNRLETSGPHTDEEKEHLQLLLPHLSKSLELHRTVSQLEQRYGAVLSVLDKLLVGLIILDPKGRVIIANTAAKRTAEESGSYKISPAGSLKITLPSRNAELQIAFKAAAKTAQATGLDQGRQMVIPKHQQHGCLLLELMPIRDDGFSDSDNIQGVALFIIDPERSELINPQGLVKIFDLTPAEADITQKLVQGASVQTISDTRNASVQTVRSQLKSLFNKTGARSQTDLVRLALKSKPPIE